MSDDRGQITEVSGQKTELNEVGIRNAEGGIFQHRAEGNYEGSEGGRQRTDVGSQKTDIFEIDKIFYWVTPLALLNAPCPMRSPRGVSPYGSEDARCPEIPATASQFPTFPASWLDSQPVINPSPGSYSRHPWRHPNHYILYPLVIIFFGSQLSGNPTPRGTHQPEF